MANGTGSKHTEKRHANNLSNKSASGSEGKSKDGQWSDLLLTAVTKGSVEKLHVAIECVKDLNSSKKKSTRSALSTEQITAILDVIRRVPENQSKNSTERTELYAQLTSQLYKYSKSKMVKPDPNGADVDWSSLWSSYFQTGDSYYLELLRRVEQPIADNGSDNEKVRFLKDLFAFCNKIKDNRTAPFAMTAEDEESFLALMDNPLKACLTGVNQQALGDSTNNLTKLCLECGFEKKAPYYKFKQVNVLRKLAESTLTYLFASSSRQFQYATLKSNLKSIFNVFILNNVHKCAGEQRCTCFDEDTDKLSEFDKLDNSDNIENEPISRSATAKVNSPTDNKIYSAVETYIFTKSPQTFPSDVLLYLSDVINIYRELPLYQWLDFVRTLYLASPTNDVDKNLSTLVNLVKNDETGERSKRALSLIELITKQKGHLMKAEYIDVLEQYRQWKHIDLVFSIFLNVSATPNCCQLFKFRGDNYYHMAEERNIETMMSVTNIFQNVGKLGAVECERVVNYMEKAITGESGSERTNEQLMFVQHVLIVWKEICVDFYMGPFKKRRKLLESLKQEEKIRRNATELLTILDKSESKTCILL